MFRHQSTVLPTGPQSFSELMEWPTYIIQQVVQDEERKKRLFAFLRRGVAVTSSYSGMDAPREILAQIAVAMRTSFNFWPQIRHIHSCDLAGHPQTILCWLAREVDSSQSCVFGNLEDRLPQEARNHLDSLAPDEKASPERKIEAYKQMWTYLHSHRKAFFQEFATSLCSVHNRQCRIIGSDTCFPDMDSQGSMQGSPGSSYSHAPSPAGKEVRVEFAGATCKGWSYAGGRAQFAHESERPHAVWLCERLCRSEQNLEDMFFQECTVAYPVQTKLREVLEDTHEVLMVKTGPELQGWPTSRPRSFTVGLNSRR